LPRRLRRIIIRPMCETPSRSIPGKRSMEVVWNTAGGTSPGFQARTRTVEVMSSGLPV
jgi:hypothetical protein